MSIKRKTYTAGFKAKLALEVLEETKNSKWDSDIIWVTTEEFII